MEIGISALYFRNILSKGFKNIRQRVFYILLFGVRKRKKIKELYEKQKQEEKQQTSRKAFDDLLELIRVENSNK